MEIKFYKCSVCGKIITMVNPTNVPTICCGKPMEELKPNTSDGAVEKHVPVVEVNDGIVNVKIGSVAHPMAPDHFIQWICIATDQGHEIKYLSPNFNPEASFALKDEKLENVYAYCNVHGLWKK